MNALVFHEHPLEGRRGSRWMLSRNSELLSFAAVLDAWRFEPGFTEAFTAQLAASPFPAFFFETPPLIPSGVGRGFEYVLLPAPALSKRPADPHSFRHQLAEAELTATFPNLGRNAVLVAPSDRGADCAHLAVFSRTASAEQQHALWAATAAAMLTALGSTPHPTPRWLSTSGLGVPWLHIRIDTKPKYYIHHPYRTPPPNS